MIELLLIRHGKTAGNQEGRYIGCTDQPLCEEGVNVLKKLNYQTVDRLYVSPKQRCIQTAEILFPGIPMTVIDDLRECDFGEFENKNYQELCHLPGYQIWLDSGGTLAFPGGEDPLVFRKRCCRGFEYVLEDIRQQNYQRAAMVVHGGTIMSILEAFADPKRPFYDWQVKNAGGYLLQIDDERWDSSRRLNCRDMEKN